MHTEPPWRLDCSPLVPAVLAGKSASEVAGVPLRAGNETLALGDIFRVSGEAGERLVIESSSARLDRVATNLAGGEIEVIGPVGDYLGVSMRAGRVVVRGRAGALAACDLRGGTMVIEGDCGDFLGGPLPGSQRGMAGGLVRVTGSAGDRAGDSLRRGMLLIEGDAGDYLGARMLAGTIGVLGAAGARIGYLMRRGSLLLFGAQAEPDASFAPVANRAEVFVTLLTRAWASQPDAGRFASLASPAARRYLGDLACGGKGEVFLFA